MEFEGFDFNFCNTNFLGTIMVLILSLNSSNSFQFLNKKYINKAYKCDFTAKRGTPNGTQKSFSKIVNSELSSDVSVMCIVILDQKLHTCQYSCFFYIPLNLQKYHFFVWNEAKIFNLYKDAKTHSGVMKTRAIRRLKA